MTIFSISCCRIRLSYSLSCGGMDKCVCFSIFLIRLGAPEWGSVAEFDPLCGGYLAGMVAPYGWPLQT